MKAVLGIDTSCYTTSCALVDQNLTLLHEMRKLLAVPQGERGLRQSEAVFVHVRQLPVLLQTMMSQHPHHVAAVCVSATPVDGADSYMPVFQAGLSIAQSIAAAMSVPLYQTTHQRGHLVAARIGQAFEPQNGYIGFHLSGGTTDLLRIHDTELEWLRSSLDLHVGQLIDRVGVRLGLTFPSGPSLETLAISGKPQGRYGAVVRNGACHLSGIEAAVMRDIDEQALCPEDIAAEVFDAIARTVCKMLEWAEKQTGYRDALLFGGVASSKLFRSVLNERVQNRRVPIKLHFGSPALSGDNAAGVAMIGAKRHFAQQQ